MELSSTPWLFENIKTMVSSLIQVTNSTKYAVPLCLMKNKNPTHWNGDSEVPCVSHEEFPKYPHLYTDDIWNKVQETYVRSTAIIPW